MIQRKIQRNIERRRTPWLTDSMYGSFFFLIFLFFIFLAEIGWLGVWSPQLSHLLQTLSADTN